MALSIFGAQAAVSLVNRALSNTSPSNSVYLNQVASAGTTAASEYAFAGKLGANLGNKSAAELTALLFANMGVSNTTIPAASFTVLQAAVTDYIAFHGTNNIGIIALQLGQLLSNLEGDVTFGAAAKAWNQEVVGAYEYSINPTHTVSQTGEATVGTSINLTAGQDSAVGTGGDDVFVARIFDNQNTLQSGDRIDGGAGNDTLKADIGSSQKFAITPELVNVERVEIRVQADQVDSGDNNIAAVGIIDAERSVGVTHWESNNSRADLIIEDVRIGASQITKDITIAFVESDPGHVDFGVYFDQYSLRSQTNTSSVLALEVLDTRSAAAGTGPLKDSPYAGFAFNVTFPGAAAPKLISLTSPAIDAAQTYAALVTAIQAAIDANPELVGFKATLGSTFQVFDTLGSPQTGSQVLITTNTGATVSAEGAGTGWIANGAVPPSSGLHTNISNSTANTTDLVTSKIILDDVGRGSTGGDLVVGGLSVGTTSTSEGVGRFEIEVRDNSKLQTISSTNNSLKEVVLTNGVTTSNSFAYGVTKKDAGNLTVNGKVTANLGGVGSSPTTGLDANLPGTLLAQTAGFHDVRLIDGSALKGNLEFTAAITQASIVKYLQLKDAAPLAPGADNITFDYKGGAGNDKMVVNIDGDLLASRSLTGREDFKFVADGGAGDDEIIVTINSTVSTAWLVDQQQLKNVTINGGDGNDTIRKPGNGDANINAGSGNDTVYAENSGGLNAIAIAAAGSTPATTMDNRATWVVGAANTNVLDLESAAPLATQFLYKGKLTVNFSSTLGGTVASGTVGLSSGAIDIPTGSNYAVTKFDLNQAIKKAINEDAVLKKLLVAEDGPGATLVIKSLIDGTAVAGDLNFAVTSTYVAADAALANAAYTAFAVEQKIAVPALDAVTANGTSITALGGITGVNTPVLGTVVNAAAAVVNLTGVPSGAHSDNIINMGAGNDVVVLGTGTVGNNDKLVFTGYDQGKTTIVNFTADVAQAAAVDKIDFSSYLTSKATAAGGALIAVTSDADATVQANSVTILTGAFTTAQKFAGLTADVLKAALNGTTTATDFGGLTGAINAVAPVYAGAINKSVLLVENNDNFGEYAAFELTATAAGDFTEVKAIGVLDFGATQTLTAATFTA